MGMNQVRLARVQSLPVSLEKDMIYFVQTGSGTCRIVVTDNAGSPTGYNAGLNPRGAYSGATGYAFGDTVSYAGASWILIAPSSTGHAPPTLPTISNAYWALLAQPGGTPAAQGDYASGTTYSALDIITHDGSSWIYINVTPGSGHAPPELPATENAYWRLLASKGTDGLSFEPGGRGPFSDRALFDDEDMGFAYLSIDGDGDDITTAVLFFKESAASGDWGPPTPFGTSDYNQLINKPPLGTASAEDVEAFASAAQGELADTAVQPEDLPAIVANTMQVDDPTGALRETKTFPQVRALLQVPSFGDLPFVVAAQNGVPGNGTDQTTALQAIINGLPAEGGNILLAGDVRWTQLTAADRRNIRFIGLGGYGAGAGQRTLFRCVAGALGNGVSAFNLKRTMNVSFEKMFVDSRDAAFTGTLLDWGDLTSGSALMSMIDCYLNVLSNVSGARGINLYGTTQGVFERVKFAGARTLIQMQNAVGVGFCNQHAFRSCSFNPTGTQYPAAGSGEGITFENCNVQASSGDGIGRFWSTDLTQPFRGVSLIGNTFYDVLTAGGIWANFNTGQGLNLVGNSLGGAASGGGNYGFSIGGGTAGVSGTPLGVAGGQVIGNSFRFMSAGINFGGSKANYNNARSLVIGGNYAYGSLSPSGVTALYGSVSETENMIWLPSEQNATPNAFGAHLNLRNLPTSATGLGTGDVWNNAGVINIVQ